MKRVIGLAAALLLASSLLSSVLMAAPPLWSKTVDDASLTINQTAFSPGVWRWTYTLTHTPEVGFGNMLDGFNAQLLAYGGGGLAAPGMWAYATDSDTASVAPGYSMLMSRSLWGPFNWTQAFWTWTPASSGEEGAVYPFGTKVFSFLTTYGDVGSGNYNLTLGSNTNTHGFSGMATPIPEPGSLVLLGLAAIGVVGARRQRR